MSSSPPPRWRRSPRLAVFAAVLAVAGVVGAFSWLAVKSFELIHSNLQIGVSSLKPVKTTGPEQVVFDWTHDACEPRDIPDVPAHAFRDANGEVHLVASHYVSRQMTGPTLDRVRHRCAVIMRSAYDRNPGLFSYKEWIFAPYTVDGTNVFALIDDEYHGAEIPGECPSGVFNRCLYNAITLARSTDGGATFRHARQPPDNLVAEVPYRYTPDDGYDKLFLPSSIVLKDGYYYALISAPGHRLQPAGTCLMRTNNLADPGSWRAWNGQDFSVQFVDPYRVRSNPEDHVCAPVSPSQISDMHDSLTYNTYFGKYLLVGSSVQYDPSKRRAVSGFYYSLSDDLVHWSQRKLLKEAVLLQTYRCGDPDPVIYASVLDPDSTSRNFETSGRGDYLYFTRLHYMACQLTLDRDLVRVPIEFSK